MDHDESDAPTNVNEYIQGEAEEGEEDAQEFAALRPAVNPQNPQQVSDASQPSPRPRPRLPKVAPGPVRNHAPGVSRTGRIAVDAKFSEFGEYMDYIIQKEIAIPGFFPILKFNYLCEVAVLLPLSLTDPWG